MSIIKRDEHNQIIPLTPSAKNALMVAASSGVLWMAKQIIARAWVHKPRKQVTMRITRRIYRRFPDGSVIEDGEDYLVQIEE